MKRKQAFLTEMGRLWSVLARPQVPPIGEQLIEARQLLIEIRDRNREENRRRANLINQLAGLPGLLDEVRESRALTTTLQDRAAASTRAAGEVAQRVERDDAWHNPSPALDRAREKEATDRDAAERQATLHAAAEARYHNASRSAILDGLLEYCQAQAALIREVLPLFEQLAGTDFRPIGSAELHALGGEAAALRGGKPGELFRVPWTYADAAGDP